MKKKKPNIKTAAESLSATPTNPLFKKDFLQIVKESRAEQVKYELAEKGIGDSETAEFHRLKKCVEQHKQPKVAVPITERRIKEALRLLRLCIVKSPPLPGTREIVKERMLKGRFLYVVDRGDRYEVRALIAGKQRVLGTFLLTEATQAARLADLVLFHKKPTLFNISAEQRNADLINEPGVVAALNRVFSEEKSFLEAAQCATVSQ